jgi:predicted alpha/beta hydrolase family esterase
MEKAEELAANLNSNLHLKADGGHFNDEFGYTEFPELWNLLSNLV